MRNMKIALEKNYETKNGKQAADGELRVCVNSMCGAVKEFRVCAKRVLASR